MPRGIDTELLKRERPIEEIVARYGIQLHRRGRALVGRCPFHPDGGRPNLYVYPDTGSFYCFRCAIGGDVISFVERIERLGFRDAVARLTGEHPTPTTVRVRPRRPSRRTRAPWGLEERACLAAAVELYHNRLLGEPAALAYVEGRGIDRMTIERCRVGYASGKELVAYLRWRRLPHQAAVRVGLLGHDGREFLAGRVVVPEVRAGQPIWLVGRVLDDSAGPKYLGLPGRKPLLGWEAASAEREVWLTEGVFDWLALRSWGYPALALVGTHVRAAALRALARFERIYLLLDNDDAGRAATSELVRTLGQRAVPVSLPGAKDVAELAARPTGRALFGAVARRHAGGLAA